MYSWKFGAAASLQDSPALSASENLQAVWWLSGGKGMLKMTGGGLSKFCDIPGRYLNAKKTPLWANATGVCLLWRKCFKLNSERSRTKTAMCHDECSHPERTNELFHLMNEPVLDVLGTMPTSCSSVTHVLTPKGFCAAAKAGASLARQLPALGTARAAAGSSTSPGISTLLWSGCYWRLDESSAFYKPESLGRETALPVLIPSAEEVLGSLDLHHRLHLLNQVSFSHSCSFPWGEDAGREAT